MLRNPFRQFGNWFREAGRAKAIADATAACLSTEDPGGYPDGRMVLLKSFDEHGFVFYTNLESMKGRSLQKEPRAALTFYWPPIHKQVRIQGRTTLVSGAEADAYWQSRPRLTQLGAWASKQSRPLASRAVLLKDVARLALKYKLGPIPRPPFWTGVRLVPHKIEFWRGRSHRLHDRFLYTKNKRGAWDVLRLYP